MAKKAKKKNERNGLTPRQDKFVEIMLTMKVPNATQAMKAAGYSPRSAEVQASKMVRIPKVAAELARRREARAKRVNLKADDVLRELSLIGQVDMLEHFNIDPLTGKVKVAKGAPEGISRAIASVEFHTHYDRDGAVIRTQAKITPQPKVPALKLLATHLGMLVHKHVIEPGDRPFQFVMPPEE